MAKEDLFSSFFFVSCYRPLLFVNWRMNNPQIIFLFSFYFSCHFYKNISGGFVRDGLWLSALHSVLLPELWGSRCQLLSPANRIITVTFTTCSFRAGVVASKLQHAGRPPGVAVESGVISSVSGSSSQPEACREVTKEKNASWFLLSQLRVLLRWEVILYFLWLPGGTNALACPLTLPLNLPSAYESVLLRLGSRKCTCE